MWTSRMIKNRSCERKTFVPPFHQNEILFINDKPICVDKTHDYFRLQSKTSLHNVIKSSLSVIVPVDDNWSVKIRKYP